MHVGSGAADVAIGCGVESISMVQPVVAKTTVVEKKLMGSFPALWMPMIETADIVAAKYGVSREDQDAYAVECQARTAAAQAAGFYDDEIVPMDTVMSVKDKFRRSEAVASGGSGSAAAEEQAAAEWAGGGGFGRPANYAHDPRHALAAQHARSQAEGDF